MRVEKFVTKGSFSGAVNAVSGQVGQDSVSGQVGQNKRTSLPLLIFRVRLCISVQELLLKSLRCRQRCFRPSRTKLCQRASRSGFCLGPGRPEQAYVFMSPFTRACVSVAVLLKDSSSQAPSTPYRAKSAKTACPGK